MVNLGIIGVANPEFREIHAPALEQLKSKTRIVGVYDNVRKRAELAASRWDASVSLSFEKLVRRNDVDAVLLLSPGWQGVLPLLSCMELRKPAMCMRGVWQEAAHTAADLHQLAEQTDSLLVIESQYRYWPSSLRARELQATELGKPLRLTCRNAPCGPAMLPAQQRWLAELLDWSRFLLQRSTLGDRPAVNESGFTVDFIRERKGKRLDAIPLEVRFARSLREPPILTIECESGSMEIVGPNRLLWRHAETPEPHEELLQEQSGILRQFDHFCRRVAGGLIPVHDLADVLWADRAAALCQTQ
ncbi:MAG: Gfo/Idh/MocA family oxidoreductase [Planctomycetaceae bacterium]|nr:Gfo/Idh/MocA family oxidoreductase [Planctomycetaceae bacterium]